MPKTETPILCKSIFKDGKTTTSRDTFTRTWISLVTQLERSRSAVCSRLPEE